MVAYSDNAAVMDGHVSQRFMADTATSHGMVYQAREKLQHVLMKVETHNHPTAISPFPGASTGAGGEIRDEGATGRGSRPKAGLTGFTVSRLWDGMSDQPGGKPAHIASPLQIMTEGPLGGAAFNNEFGRPNLAGYFREYEQTIVTTTGEGVQVRQMGYHKPIMIAGGLGSIDATLTHKIPFPPGTLLVQLGGPGMRIGMGGGAASSMSSGANAAHLDFDSVQRGNPEIERRAQEVINHCWAMGEHNPILAIHDVGAGGLSNAFPELVNDAGRGARFDLRQVPLEESGLAPKEIWCNESQERYVLAISPETLDAFRALCERERCPFAVVGVTTETRDLVVGDVDLAAAGAAPTDGIAVDMPMDVLLGKPPRMQRDVHTITHQGMPLDVSDMSLQDAVIGVLSHPTVASKRFLVTIGDRAVGGLTHRDQMVGPWQLPVADVVQLLVQQRRRLCRHLEVHEHGFRVMNRKLAHGGRIQRAPHRAFQRIGQGAGQPRPARDRHLVGLQQRLRHGVGIGAHQPARAQLDAAEVAHHGGQHAVQVLLAQHVQHGPPGRATGLAVVHRRRIAAGQQRPAHMRGIGVRGAQGGHHPQRLGAVFHRLHAGQEAAFLDDQLVADRSIQSPGHGRRWYGALRFKARSSS